MAAPPASPEPPPSVPPAPATATVSLPVTGGVTGTVTLKGKPRSQDESFYAKANGCGESPVRTTENWKVGPKGELADVAIWVVDPRFSPEINYETVNQSLKQLGCRYEPHVTVVRAGDTVEIINGDPTLHNVRARVYQGPAKPPGADLFNFGQSYQGQKDNKVFDQPGTYLMRCDVHSWMQSWIVVLPKASLPSAATAVTAKDGTFKLVAGNSLLDGDYKIQAWHPRFKAPLEQTLTVKGGVGTVNFEFDGALSF